jgi:hypothetical protein
MRSIGLGVLCAVLLAACGADEPDTGGKSTPAKTVEPTPSAPARLDCKGAIKLKTKADSGLKANSMTAKAETVEGTDCATARRVIREWATQQVGGEDAKLPAGWTCESDSVCTDGSGATVTFVINLD